MTSALEREQRPSRAASLQFLGAAGTVTGSMHLIRVGERRVLLDCGLFQGLKALRLRNRTERVPDPRTLDAVVLSHAHIDHTGYLPGLVRQGFRGPVYCTAATAALLGVMLPDSARLQEEEAERANRHRYSKHDPALPLYTTEDAAAALDLLKPCGHAQSFPVCEGVKATYRHAGHILGAATVQVDLADAHRRLVFSGDLGRWNRPILPDPEPVMEADVLLLESTYGDRTHQGDGDAELARIINEAASRDGALLVPAFAVGRAQELLWWIDKLEREGRIPSLPVYLDSPMAIEVTDLYTRHRGGLDKELEQRAGSGGHLLHTKRCVLTRTGRQSRALNDLVGPAIIIAASGMATGGRILHHLSIRLSDPRTTVLLVGFQAEGTRGRVLREGARTLRILGRDVAVGAKIETLDAMSAHADREELLRWVGNFATPPRQTYLVHGEPAASESLAAEIRARHGWAVAVAADRQTVDL